LEVVNSYFIGSGDFCFARLECIQIGYMKTVSYTIRLDEETFERVEEEARRRKKSLADVFREAITYGLPALPPLPGMDNVIADTWEKLGAAPEILTASSLPSLARKRAERQA
jgi:hypothetical protein